MSAHHNGRILVVDDDPRIRKMLASYFENEGYIVESASNGIEMKALLQSQSFDIVLLDLVLPGGQDGLDLARELRATSDIPIIMLTGRDDVIDRILGLEVGADDYIAKPFHLREVHARLKTILRRRLIPIVASEILGIVKFNGWTFDRDRRRLSNANDLEVELSTGEFDMLVAFLDHPGRVLTRERLMDITHGRSLESFDRAIDAQVVRLRRKIESDPKHPQLIKSVRGVGYVFTAKFG